MLETHLRDGFVVVKMGQPELAYLKLVALWRNAGILRLRCAPLRMTVVGETRQWGFATVVGVENVEAPESAVEA